jgi:CHAT domain-containing protein
MKKNESLISGFWSRFFDYSFAGNVLVLLIIILNLFSACATKMSLQEAKQVAVSMNEKALNTPPRRIDDILGTLDHGEPFDSAIGGHFRTEIEKPRPQTDNAATLSDYYHRRGSAAKELGRYKQALSDLRLALDYSRKSGITDYKLLRSLAYAEFGCGNFKDAIKLLEKSLMIKENPSTYKALVKFYARVGDLESAVRVKKRGVAMCNSVRGQKGWGRWPVLLAAKMNADVLEAQGKFAEAERYHRKALQNWTESMKSQHPIGPIFYRAYLAQTLKNQNRLVEAEFEIRAALKAMAALDRNSEIFGSFIIELGEILLRQGRLQDAEKIMRAGLAVMEESQVPEDTYFMAEGRMRLGEVLAAEQKFIEAMQQFDLARSGMQHNQYLYENNLVRNPALMLSLVRTGRIEEAYQRITAIHAQNRNLFGEKHYRTAEALGFRGMVYALQKNDRQALRDFSDAFAILLDTGGADTFSYGKKVRRKIIAESYLALLAKVRGKKLEKVAGIDASLEAFKLADALTGTSVRSAIGASMTRAAVTSQELADLVRKEQDAQKQLKLLEGALSDNLAAPVEQQLPEVIQELKTKIDTLTRARRVLADEINTRFPKYAELTSPKPVSISQLHRHLHPGEAFVSIYSADDQSYVWAIPSQGEVVFSTVPFGRQRLSQMVADLRQALDPKPKTLGDIPEFDVTMAYELYRNMLEPVEKGWQSAKDLLIVAQGPLGQFPFAILPTAPVRLGEEKQLLFSNYKKVPWLIRKASITRLPSASTFVNLRGAASGDPRRKAFAGFGDPVFNLQQLVEDQAKRVKYAFEIANLQGQLNVRGIRISDEGTLDNDKIVSCTLDKLNRLPDTSAEIKHIAEALGANPNDDVFLGRQASEQRVKSMDLSDRRVIVFATHALVPGDLDGLDQPALALSAPSIAGDNEDGLLTMEEILRLKLKADWVVLSACNTGAAEGKGAEAISGLGRAFFYAGTKAILVSMWPVETTSARELTTALFRFQKENKTLSRARALRKSMLSLIDSPGYADNRTGEIVASFAHPLFWAPFIIVGDNGGDVI